MAREMALGASTFEYKTAKATESRTMLGGTSGSKNNGGLLGGAGYLGAGLVAGVGGIFEGISDLVVGSAALLAGDKEYAKYVYQKDTVGDWFRDIEEEYNPGAGMQFFGSVTQGIGQSSVMFVPVVGQTAFFMGLIGQGVGEGVRQTGELGLREYAYGTLTGVTEGLLEKLVGAGGRAAKRLATGTAATSLIRSGVRNGVLKTMLSEASGEFVEEFASAYTDVMWQRMTGVNRQATVSLRDAAYAGLVGFVSGGIMSGSVYGINAGVNAHRGAVIREEGNTQTMLNTATAISASLKGKRNFRGKQALPALRASMDAFSKLSDEAKASKRGDMLLGEIQAATAQLEVALQVDDRVKVIQSGNAEDLTRYAAVASQYLGYTVTPEMVKNDTDGVASAVAIVDFVTGMVTNSKAAAFEADVARVIESDTAPALKGVQDFDENADHQYYRLGDQVVSTVRVVDESGKVTYNFGIGKDARRMGIVQGLDASGVRARMQTVMDAQNKKAAEAAQRAAQTRGEASEVTDGQVTAQNAAEGKKTGTKRRGEVRFEDGVSATTREQRQAVGLARVLSRVVGMDIVFYDAKNYETAPDGTNEKNSNGFFDPKDNSIHLDLQNAATDNKTVTYTLSHELVHFIKKWSPEKYNAFARFLFSQYEDYGISPSALVAGKMVSLKTKNAGLAMEELVADACERLLTDSRAVTRLAALRSSDLTLFEKIKLHIEQMYARITHANVRANTVEGRALGLMKDELGRINKLFEDAAVDAAENYKSSTEKGAKQQTGDGLARRQAKTATDAEYLAAVRRGDEATARRMVEEAARDAGYTEHGYHGTRNFGFTELDVSHSDDKITFFVTDSVAVASGYSSAPGVRGISKKFGATNEFVNFEDTNVELAREIQKLLGEDVSETRTRQIANDIHQRFKKIWSSKNPYVDYKKRAMKSHQYISGILEPVMGKDYVTDRNNAQRVKDRETFIDFYHVIHEAMRKYEVYYSKTIRRLASTNGNYELFVDPEGLLEIDCKGAEWDEIQSDVLPKPGTEEFKKYENVEWKPGVWTTRSVSAYAKDHGYRGVWYKNIVDRGTFDRGESSERLSNIYALFYPQEQAKSADAVTYDKRGKVIPLSERFNAANNDIRYQRKAAEAHREAAVERFGVTSDFREAGFVLPDGSMLDFSGGIKGRRGDDHGKIRLIYGSGVSGSKAIARFLSEGNVRISEMARGIEVGEGDGLTASQYNVISRFVARMSGKGDFYVDYTREDGTSIGSATYEGNVSAEEVIWDIRDFYRSGEVRDPSSEVYYQKKGTDATGNPDNELRLADLPPVDKGKAPAKAAKKESARERDLRERNARQAGMVRDLREENRHLRRRNVVEGRAFRSVSFLSDMIRERKYISSGMLENEDMKAAIKPLTRIKSVYRMKQDATLIRECIRDFGVFYSTRNDMFMDESAKKGADEQTDGEKWVIRTSIVEDIAMISARVGSEEGLSLEEFEAVDRVLQEAARMYREYGTVVIKGRRMVTAKLAEDTLHDLQESHSSASGTAKSGVVGWLTKVGNVIKKVYTYQVIDPRSVFRAMEGYSRKGMLTQLFDEVREGEVQSRVKQVEMTKPIDEFLKTHKGYEKRLKKGIITFDGHKVTVGQAISLYELSKREQAVLHLEKGGIKWEGPDGELRSLKSFTLNNAREIERQLNEDDRAFIALVEHFFNADAKAVKEAADAKILGYTNTLSSHYFPIKVDGTEIAVDVSNLSRMLHQQIMTVYNASFNKNTVEGAKNAVIVGDVLDVTFRHAQMLANYSELYLPMQAFNKVYNARVEVAPTQQTTVRKYLERVWQANSKTQASGFEKYITKLFADIQGVGPERGTFDRLLAKFRGGFYSSALGLNPGTAAKQPTSLPMILADPEVDMDCFVKSFSMPSGKRMLEVMDKYCPLAYVKNAEGGAAQAFGVVDEIRGIGEKTMFMITGMDRQLTCRIFCVAQQQILKDKGYAIGSEENLREAGKLAQRLMFKTQSGYTTTERSGMMRSTSEIARTATMFTSDAMKHLSCYVDALGEFEANRKRLKREDTAENRAAWRRSKETVARTVGAQVSSAVLLALVAQLFRWIYDKEPEEGETVLETMAKDFVGTELGMLPVVSQITDYFIDGYDISHFTYDMFNDMLSNVRGLTQLAVDAANGKPVDEKAIALELRKLAFNAGTVTGIPVRNVHTTVYGLWKRLEPATAYKYNTLYYDATVGDLQKALDRGNERLAQSVLEVLQKEKTSEKTKGTAVRELVSLYDAGYDEIVPRGVPSKITVSGETENDPKKVVVLTAAQVKQFEKIYGGSAEAVASLVAREDYRSLGEEERAQAVKLVYDAYYNRAAHAVAGVKLSRMSVLSDVVDIKRLAVAKATVGAMEDTVSRTKKQQAVAYVRSLKLAAGEREAVLYACGYGGEAIETALVSYVNRSKLTDEQLAAFAALLDGDVRNGRLVLTKKK